MRIRHTILLGFLALLSLSSLQAQDYYAPGVFALGVRNTANLFAADGSSGLGAGGQFKIGFGQKVNTEWFYDYILSRAGETTFRQDHHVGWSVQFAPFGQGFGTRAFTPYFLGGQCFDLTRVTTNYANGPGNNFDTGQIFSAAAQIGAGLSKFVGPRLEMTLQAQYMVHLGKHVHVDDSAGPTGTTLSVLNETSFAGHLLLTFSANYYLFKLWKQ